MLEHEWNFDINFRKVIITGHLTIYVRDFWRIAEHSGTIVIDGYTPEKILKATISIKYIRVAK